MHNDINWLLSYPDNKSNGNKGLGHQIVRSILSFDSNINLYEYFYDDIYKDKSDFELPNDLDIISFSIPYERNYLYCLKMISHLGIKPRSSERREDKLIIIAGGFAMNYNPLPMFDFIDIFLIGDAEVIVPKILPTLTNCMLDKSEKLQLLAKLQGVFVPGYSMEPAIRLKSKNIDTTFKYQSINEFDETDAHKKFYLIEHIRGCANNCRFCALSYLNKPPRIKSIDNIKMHLNYAKEDDSIARLIAASDCENPYIEDIFDAGEQLDVSINTGSQRVDRISDRFLNNTEKSQSVLSIAPETGSIKLRKIINKDFNDEEVLAVIKKSKNIKVIHLYMILGIISEDRTDLNSNIEFIEKIYENMSIEQKLYVYFNPLIPKPHTPFQWAEIIEYEEFLNRVSYIIKNSKFRGQIKYNFMDSGNYIVQKVLTRGDSSVGSVLEQMINLDDDYDNWIDAIEKAKFKYFDHNDYINTDKPLPWESAIRSLNRKLLTEEWINAKELVYSFRECNLNNCSDCICKFIDGGELC